MTKQITIVLASLLTLTAVGCDDEANIDPVWGDWEAKANGCNTRTEFEIDDDYKGDGKVVLSDCSICQANLEIDPEGDNEYEIEIDYVDCNGTEDLQCELDDDELECEVANGGKVDFERD